MTMTDSFYIAFDPGHTTGVATLWTAGDCRSFESFELEGRDTFLDWLWNTTGYWRHDFHDHLHIVGESYIITPQTVKKSRQYDPLLILGAAEFIAGRVLATFRTNTPSSAKNFSTDAKLKTLGFYVPGFGHANDASRHLLKALVDDRDPTTLAQLKEAMQ